jgi:hypothetical protein
MLWSELFDFVRIINLPDRTDRRRDTQAELKRFGLPVDDKRVRFLTAIRPESSEGFSSIGARGCYLSHLSGLREAREHQAERALILEDDIAFNHSFQMDPQRLASEIHQADWDMLWLGHTLPERGAKSIVPATPDLNLLTAHCYAIHRRSLSFVIEALEKILSRSPGHPEGGPMHLDGAYSTIRKQNPNLRTLVIHPSLAGQRPSRTDIHPLKWFDRVPALRETINWTRRLRRR